MKRGIFIVFEGGEKVGKTTQLKRAKQFLEEKYYSVVLTHEPGGGDPALREKLLDKKGTLTPEEELDYFCRDRALHINNIIAPALENGTIVLCDRFEPSTIAYQGYARGIDLELIKKKSAAARYGMWPNLIILLDADPAAVLSREEATSRFDAETLDFHHRVRYGFLAQAKNDPVHWRIVDAEQPLDVVWKNVKKYLDEFLQIKKEAMP
ncbi:MAG: dTMP kinase [Parcubacteria group bacterium Gr01-1014_29]|nr:MAG: dTMP kinase [Parcubacteria group bacterium Gr01-1014_29]